MHGSGYMRLPNHSQIFVATFQNGVLLSVTPLTFDSPSKKMKSGKVRAEGSGEGGEVGVGGVGGVKMGKGEDLSFPSVFDCLPIAEEDSNTFSGI
jgi:hypothetical protein